MTFEGDPKVVPVKGIVRAGADSIVADGAMNEVVGLEYKDGSYVPYEGAKNYGAVFPTSDVEAVYVHKTSSENNVIIKTSEGLFFIPESLFLKGEGGDWGNWDRIYSGNVKDVEFVGNVICISTTSELQNFIFQNGQYDKWQIDKELLPNISFRVDLGLAGKKSGSKDAVGVICSSYETYSSETSVSLIIKARGKAKEEGGLTGFFLVCAAYRLKTGEYIKASNPLLMCRPMHKFGNKFYNVKTGSSEFESDNGTVYTPNIGDEKTIVYTEQVLENLDYIPKYEGNSGVTGTINTLRIGGTDGTMVFSSTDVFYPPMSCCAQVALSDNMSIYRATALSNKLQYKIDKNIGVDEQLIDSLCIFISPEIDPFLDITDIETDSNKNYLHSSVYYDLYYYRMVSSKLKSTDEIIQELEKINTLYLVDKIEYDDIVQSSDWIDVELEGKLGDSLLIRESLPISAFDCSVISGPSLTSYNSRLHVFDYIQNNEIYLDIEGFNLQGGFGQFDYHLIRGYDSAYIIVDIEDSNGKSKLVKYFDKPMITESTGVGIAMNPYISFHHPNAKKISIILTYKLNNHLYFSFSLRKSKHGGYSYFINEELGANVAVADSINGDTINSYITPSNGDTRRNTMRVSETYDVNTLPYINTYTIGKGSIIGLASLSITLSQDTFGQYPLLVFCTDGIYSMEVDTTGTGVYNNVAPFSREVCVNRNSICEIDGAVLFASSKGLMVATAQGVEEFVPTLNGKPKHGPTDNQNEKGIGLSAYKSIISHAQSTYLVDCVDTQDFKEYVSHGDTHITYASEKNKIVVYNKHKNYIYWIDIQTRNTTKLPIGISIDDNNYPSESYVTTDGEIILLNENSNKGEVDTLFQTRPIKLDGGFHSAMRVIVRGYFKGEDDKFAVLLVLGSYDGVNWQPIGATERMLGEGFEDIGCVTDRVSHKYAMVIFTARLSRDSHIDGIELTNHNKYNNKLK